ncbi:unnamed protein product [Larinioides sclopetarius]|uniref:Chitin-binding type-2 domain-containing protein n=1 Tax=Larinioides sclopetarius TaxID=280406 RepID=A0AAV1ZVK4_9ARAC
MRHLLILCVLLVIAVYSNAVSYSNEVEDEDELSEDIDSLELFEDDTLDADMNNLYKRKSHEKHSKEKKPKEHSKEKKSKEHSKEKKSKEHSKEKKSKERKHSKEKKSKEHDHSKEKKSREKKSSREYTKRPTFLDDEIVLPHEKFCQYFYRFVGFEASLVSCSKGHRFDAEKFKCLKTKEVNCGKRKKNVGSSEEKKARINFKCPKWYGLHKHEYYCHLYYSCQNKKGRLFMCPPGKLFDDHNQKCADRRNVDCNNRIDPNDDKQPPTVKPEAFVCPKSNGKYPHERDCGAFYKCDNRRYKIQRCSKGKLYNERKRTCESENKVTCGSRIHPDLDPDEPEDKVIDPNPNFNCRENFGRYNHDQFCNWYYQCHDRRPSVRECRRGWRYHSHGRRCRERQEVTCDGKPDHEDATTEEITTPISTEPETTTPTPTEPETTTPTPTEPETITPTPTEPEPTTTTPTPTEPEPTTTTPTPTEPEPTTTTPTPTEPEPTTTTPTPTEPEPTTTTPTPTEPEPTTTPTPTEPEPTTTTTTPTEPEPTTTTTTPTEPEPTTTTTTEEPTTTKKPKVTAPDTECDEDDVDCIIEDLGITPDWFVCPEDMGSYPHPSSRKLFIFCLNWKPSVKKCGQDLLYSEDLRTCVHPN